jgi:hypothetical protein
MATGSEHGPTQETDSQTHRYPASPRVEGSFIGRFRRSRLASVLPPTKQVDQRQGYSHCGEPYPRVNSRHVLYSPYPPWHSARFHLLFESAFHIVYRGLNPCFKSLHLRRS